MSERERWIVYPLLFLALGAALRDKLLKQSVADKIYGKEIYCDTLTVIDEQGRGAAKFEGGTLQLQRLQANEVQAGNLAPAGQAAGTPSLQQLMKFLQQAGGAIRVRPAKPQPPPAESSTVAPATDAPATGNPASEPTVDAVAPDPNAPAAEGG